jgi:hypothetical protein
MTNPQIARMRRREEHYERFFGPMEDAVMDSTDFKTPHIDIYQFSPRGDREFWTLVTGGMSDLRQPRIPEGMHPRAELFLYASQPEPWMFDVLKGLAEMPFDDDTYIHWWHTVPNGKPMTAKPSLLTNFFFLPPKMEEPAFNTLAIDGDPVDMLWMVPITDSERTFKVAHDGYALEDLFDEQQLSPIINESRSSLV